MKPRRALDHSLLTSKVPNSEVSVAELLGDFEEEPLADRWKVLVHSAELLDHLVRQQRERTISQLRAREKNCWFCVDLLQE